jgi:hypothetical protein
LAPNVEHWSEIMTKLMKLVLAGVAVSILSVGVAVAKRPIKEYTPILASMPEFIHSFYDIQPEGGGGFTPPKLNRNVRDGAGIGREQGKQQ